MNFKSILILLLFVIFVSCTSTKSMENKTDSNYVPNAETAIKIAEAIWIPIYGTEILNKKPFTAKLINNKIWRVEGTISLDDIGGVPIIEIQKKDCKILKVTHTK